MLRKISSILAITIVGTMLTVAPALAANTKNGGNKDFNQPNVNIDVNKNNRQNKPVDVNNQQKSEWDTTITATVTGAYTFYVSSTNGASLYVGDMNLPLIVGKFSQAATEQRVTVKLTGGRTYAVKVEYFNPNESFGFNIYRVLLMAIEHVRGMMPMI